MAECCEDTIISVFPKLFGEIFSKTNQEPNRQISSYRCHRKKPQFHCHQILISAFVKFVWRQQALHKSSMADYVS